VQAVISPAGKLAKLIPQVDTSDDFKNSLRFTIVLLYLDL
jgi:hypothetical protein